MLLPLLALLSELLVPQAIDTSGRRARFGYNTDYDQFNDYSPEGCLVDFFGRFRYDRNPSVGYSGSHYGGDRPYHFRHRHFHQGQENNDGHFLNKKRLNRGDNGHHEWHHYGNRHPNFNIPEKPNFTAKPTHEKPKFTAKPTTEKPSSTTKKPSVQSRVVCGRNYESKIIGGKPTDARNWRWMASVMKRPNEHMCGGSLISRLYVLTAAHCIDRVNIETIHVRLGEHDFDRTDDGNPEDYAIAKVIRHPRYDRVGYKNDIGLIKLARAALLSPSVTTICLPASVQDYAGRDAVVVGWGLVSYGGTNSNALRQVSVVIWNNTECSKAYSFTSPIQPYYVCAGSKNGQDSCSGDSGGPLMIQNDGRWTAIGVVSWGFRCGEPAYPGVYARIDNFLRWIKRNTLR